MYTIAIPTVITNGHFDREKTLMELRRAKANMVVLALDREIPHRFSSRENLALLRELLAYYKETGFKTCVWLGETFGHSAEKIGDAPYTNIRHITGETIGAFCPCDPVFRRDFAHWVQSVAQCGADMILLDDDFRLSYRGSLGCACDLHINAIEKILGRETSIEELREKVVHGGANEVRSAWLKAQADSMKNFALEMRRALDKIAPSCRMGFCACYDTWDATGTDPVELSKCFAGNTKPFLRTIGAPYWVTQGNTYTLGQVCEMQRNEAHWLEDSGVECISEGDMYPRPRFATPAAYGECFDQILHADGKLDGILKYMLDYVSDATYEKGYIDAHVRNKPLYEAIDRAFTGGKTDGIMPYIAPKQFENTVFTEDTNANIDDILNRIRGAALPFATEHSLATAYDENCAKIVFGENARFADIKGCVIDAPAAMILMERGVDVGIKQIQQMGDHVGQGFSDVPQEYYIAEDQYVRLSGGVRIMAYEPMPGAEILTKYRYDHGFTNGILKYENAQGQRFILLPYDMEKARHCPGWLYGYARRRLIDQNLAWLQYGREPEAYLASDNPRVYILVKRFEDRLSIGIWNLFEDAAYDLRIRLGNHWNTLRVTGGNAGLFDRDLVLETPLQPFACCVIELFR